MIRHIRWKLIYEYSPYIVGLIFLLLIATYTNFTPDLIEKIIPMIKIVGVFISTMATIFVAIRALSFGSNQSAEFYFKLTKDPLAKISGFFRKVMDTLKQPVCIFIDDLDRCSSEYIVEILEGIQTSFRHEKVCYIIAADKDWIRTSFQNHFSDFGGEIGKDGQSLGYLFLETIFQVSTPLPGMGPKLRNTYWNKLLDTNAVDTGERKVFFDKTAYVEALEIIGQTAETITHDVSEALLKQNNSMEMKAALVHLASIRKQDVEKRSHILSTFAHLLPENPRAMKRFLNAFTLRHSISIMEGTHVPLEKLARWTILEQSYPRVANLLALNPSFISYLGQENTSLSIEQRPKAIIEFCDVEGIDHIINTHIMSEDTAGENRGKLTEQDIRSIVGNVTNPSLNM